MQTIACGGRQNCQQQVMLILKNVADAMLNDLSESGHLVFKTSLYNMKYCCSDFVGEKMDLPSFPKFASNKI